MRCKIHHYSDMTECHTCGLVWDRNDSDPPPCPDTVEHGPVDQEAGRFWPMVIGSIVVGLSVGCILLAYFLS